MTNKELIVALLAQPLDAEVMILDGFNGGGYPRTLNAGPWLREVGPQDAEECADCEDLVGEHVIIVGYGSY